MVGFGFCDVCLYLRFDPDSMLFIEATLYFGAKILEQRLLPAVACLAAGWSWGDCLLIVRGSELCLAVFVG